MRSPPDGRLRPTAHRPLAVTFLYLGDGPDPVRTEVDEGWMTEAFADVNRLTEGIANEEFRTSALPRLP
jgi:hypothetical protein